MINIQQLINDIVELYQRDNIPWYIAFSGGKDSTCVIKLIYNALLTIQRPNKYIYVVYCDTGVEMPAIRSSVLATLNKLQTEALIDGLPIKTIVAEPNVEDRFFTNVLGKGYMPPSFMFRWCTSRLRIKPLQKIVNNTSNIIVLGTRCDESPSRNRTLDTYRISEYFFKQSMYANSLVFCPIIHFGVEDVWMLIRDITKPYSINVDELRFFYEGIVGGPTDSFTKEKGRYGCWTCTVVRQDKAGQSLLKKGYSEMEYLLQYRQLMIDMKNDCKYREETRRNGCMGKGPFTLEAREILLKNLQTIQKKTGIIILSNEEVNMINNHWNDDLYRNNSSLSSCVRSSVVS